MQLAALCTIAPAVLHAQLDSVAPDTASSPRINHRPTFTPADTVLRPRVATLSDAYYTRLHIHLLASYVTLPIMATEYVLGEKLIHNEQLGIRSTGGLADAHVATAVGLTGLFALNTVTGVLNLYEARHLPEGRTRRTIHAVAMLVADGGFAYTASLGGGAKLPRSETGIPGAPLPGADQHRRAAIASISVATAATLMMWLWKN
jgi:hypothetical protein